MVRVISIHSANHPLFLITDVEQRAVLNYASLKGNSNKYYIIEFHQGGGDYPFRIYTEYGRIGRNPRKEGRFFNSRLSAKEEFNHILSSKRAKGYEHILIDDDHFFIPTVTQFQIKTSSMYSLKGNEKMVGIIEEKQQEETRTSYSPLEPLGKLSDTQIARGFQILDKIEEKLHSGSNDFDNLSNQFYSIIPTFFGNKVDYHQFIINNFSKLVEKRNLLEGLNLATEAENSFEYTYTSTQRHHNTLHYRTKEYKRLIDNAHDTKHHHLDDHQELLQTMIHRYFNE
ncbi:WGR domain-containing protein [Neobacillus cucumis]|uniref:WGR domain-containing protein n=1 Tax=Neobacillus cucumis TaxID=1740721 RepID=UPI0018E05A03|nr:WGR domain-containing protein [Neobacillus cucumis]MBI0580897.1 WGR domain-containing protein [Neobacillus cucumis]